MTITPELDACASAMYDRLGYAKPWSLLLPEVRDGYHQAARACLGALVPVSDRVLDDSVQASMHRGAFARIWSRAIRHIIGETP